MKLKPNKSYRNDTQPEDLEEEWDQLLTYTRDLKFGFDEILREVNTADEIVIQPNGQVSNTGSTGTNIPDPYENQDPTFVVAAREDLVAEYLGQTAPKTKKVLESALGGVLFIDEAYSICNMDGGSKDKYGEECLSTINEFMSLHPDEIIIIFAGYKDLLETGPFSVQPGLKRRFMWQFSMDKYTPHQLFEIFKLQLKKKGWGLTDIDTTQKIFLSNADAFPAFGGDTERAAFYSELEHSRDYIRNGEKMVIDKLNPSHVKRGIDKLRENNIDSEQTESTNPMANLMKMLSTKNVEEGLKRTSYH
jgi:hypothetical protein